MKQSDKLFDSEGKIKITDGMRYYKKTDEQNNMVRFIIKLKMPVNKDALLYAFEKSLNRHRTFRFTVVSDEKNYYLKENNQKPVVHFNDGKRYVVGNDQNNGYLTRVGYNGDTISVDFFHGITDGVGVTAFNKTLLYYYFKKLGIENIQEDGIMLENDSEDIREYLECSHFVPDDQVQVSNIYQYEKAFQLPDKQIESKYECKFYEFKIDARSFEQYMRDNSSSRSGVFAQFMNSVIAENNDVGDEPVVAALAVNARPFVNAQMTNMCCVSTVPVWYDKSICKLSESEQLKASRQMIVDGTQNNNIIFAMQRNKAFDQKLEHDFETLLQKQQFAKEVNKRGGVKYTYGLGYLGEMKFGNGIDENVSQSYMMLCANTIPVILEIAKFGDSYHISYCTHIENDPYVFKLKDKFVNAGITCMLEQKDNFAETLAVF